LNQSARLCLKGQRVRQAPVRRPLQGVPSGLPGLSGRPADLSVQAFLKRRWLRSGRQLARSVQLALLGQSARLLVL